MCLQIQRDIQQDGQNGECEMNLEEETRKLTIRARHANPIIFYDGGSLQRLYKNVISIDYMDFAEGSSDEITLRLSDQKMNFFDGFFPETGKDLDVYIEYYYWEQAHSKESYHCGNFLIDDITVQGRPRELMIKAVSQPVSEFKDTPRTKTWKETTLKTIASEFMAVYKMSGELFFHGTDPQIKEIEQDEEDDATFLNRVCEKYGFSLKIYKFCFVIFQKSFYESRPVVRTYDGEKEWDSGWEWNRTLSGTYTGAKICYTNPNKEKKKGEKPASDIEVLVGTEGKILYVNETVETEAEAIEIAKARINKENEKVETLSFSVMFDPRLIASSNIEVINLTHVEGKYFIKKVHVSMSSNGLKMHVFAYKIVQRL